MSAVWIMLVASCPGFSDRDGCRTEILPGSFPTDQACKEISGLLKSKQVSYTCRIRWLNDE